MDLHRSWGFAWETPFNRRRSAFLSSLSRAGLFRTGAAIAAFSWISVAHAQLPYVEDFSTTTAEDAAQTTADWNTGLRQLRLPISPSLVGTTFDETTAVEIINPEVETRSVSLADLNGDGFLDAIFGVAGRTRVVLNNGSGGFGSAAYRAPDGANTRAIATGDVDRDGDIDFVEGNLNRVIRLYLNDGTGRNFVAQDVSTSPAQTDHVILVDVNDDGLLDIVTANLNFRSNLIFLNTGDPLVPFGVGGQDGVELGAGIRESSREVLAGDIDQDGDLDLVILNEAAPNPFDGDQPQYNRVFINQGSGSFATSIINPGPDDSDLSLSGGLGDMNGDGFPDLVVVNYLDTEASKIYFNNASGAPNANPFTIAPVDFEPAPPAGAPLLARTASLADADNDGDLDIFLTTDSNDYRNRIYFNDGSGASFSVADVGPVGQAPLAITDTSAIGANTLGDAVGDLDNDGDLDWIVANYDATDPSGALANNVYRNGGSVGAVPAQQLHARAVSVAVDTSGVQSVRLQVAGGAVGPEYLNQLEYWVSGNGGGKWSQIQPDGRPVPVEPGADVRWRAMLRSDSPATAASLALTLLELDSNENAPVVNTPIGTVDLVENDPNTNLPIVPDFSDADGDALRYSVTGLPNGTGLAIDPMTGEIAGTPNGADVLAAPMTVRIIATDGGLTGFDEFTVNVEADGNPPVFDSTPVTAVDQDQPYLYAIVASDPDAGETAQLVITAPTLPAWLGLTDNGDGTATLAGTPMAGDVGSHPVSLTVTDPVGLAATQDFTVVVANVNDAPAFISTPPTTANEYVPYVYDVMASDPDAGDLAGLVITADVVPNWLTLTDNGNGSATLRGTPDASHVYIDNSVSLVVTDPLGATATQDFVVTVSYENDPPVIISSPPVAGATAGSNYVYTIQATDADASHTDMLVFSADTLPGWLSLNNIGGGRARLAGTPTAADAAGDNTVTVVVTDRDGLTDMQSFVVNIVINEAPPEFVSDPELSATESEEYRYSIRAVDPNGDAVSISATSLPGWLSFEETGNGLAILTGTPSGNDVGQHTVVLEARELPPAGGLSSTQQFVIVVTDTGDGPSITLNGAPRTAVLLGEVYEDPGASAFDAQDGDLTQAIVMQSNVDTSRLGTYTVTYTVADSAGNQGEAQRTVRVVELTEPGGIGSAGWQDLLWLGAFLLAGAVIRRSRSSDTLPV